MKKDGKKIVISVGDLVSWVHRSGDLNHESSHYGRNRAAEGRQIHTWLQKKRRKQYPQEYQAEVSMSYVAVFDDLEVSIQGRIDGVREEVAWLEEIKSLAADYDDLEADKKALHWAQLYLYGYLYSQQQHLDEMTLCLSYVQVESKALFAEERHVTHEELQQFFQQSIAEFVKWAKLIMEQKKKMLQTAALLEFPFGVFRPGQREMSAQVYQAIRHAEPLMVQAATGIGKTLATIFPSVKAMGKGYINRIVYLSARGIGQQVVREALQLLRAKGLRISDMSITAKSKVCLQPEAGCDPLLCAYAKDYFGKLKPAMYYAMENFESFARENIDIIAKKYQICPFEFSLDIAQWCDAIICDYNYLFDPNVSLKRFFHHNDNNPVLLVDEAHNLVERARGMYSVRLVQAQILALKRLIQACYPAVSRQLALLSRAITQLSSKVSETENAALQRFPEFSHELSQEILQALRLLRYKMEAVLARDETLQESEKFLDLFFALCHFLNMSEVYDDDFVFNVNPQKKQRWIEIYCLNPAKQIQSIVANMQSSIYFSATLTPHDYYAEIFFSRDMHSITIPSPFPPANQLTLLATQFQTTFKQREQSIHSIRELIRQICGLKKGNYLVFFPSYAYLDLFLEEFESAELDLLVQQRNMNEKQKEAYLAALNHHNGERNSVLALAVMGAGFSEGIDLDGEQLIACFVLGVGLAQINFHQDLIKAYYAQQGKSGFSYAYQYPGISKVLQSAGRVIRSMDDNGLVILIDARYKQYSYRQYLPSWWQLQNVGDNRDCLKQVALFWSSQTDD